MKRNMFNRSRFVDLWKITTGIIVFIAICYLGSHPSSFESKSLLVHEFSFRNPKIVDPTIMNAVIMGIVAAVTAAWVAVILYLVFKDKKKPKHPYSRTGLSV